MKHVLLAIAVYSAAVLEVVGAPSSLGLGAIDLFAAAGLLCLCHARGNALLAWMAVVGLLSDVVDQSPLGIGMGVAVVLGYAFEGTTRAGATGSRWLARAGFLVLFPLIVAGVRGGVAGSPIPAALATAVVPAAVTMVTVLVAELAYSSLRTLVGGHGFRTSRHGF